MEEQYLFKIIAEDEGQRVDHFLVRKLPQITRSRIQALIKQGFVVVDQQKVNPAKKLKDGQNLRIVIPSAQEPIPQAQVIPFGIVYEDDDLIVVNKPAGLVVHPGAGNPDFTLVNGLISHCGDTLSGIGGVKRPGIVHRLDKGTSGLMVVAKNDFAHVALSSQFASRSLKRIYIAMCWGIFQGLVGTIAGNIGRDPHHRQRMKVLSHGGKEAITDYKVVENFSTYASLVECQLRTGRTHQIRVHLASIKHGLIGDALYARPPRGIPGEMKESLTELTHNNTRPCLHAYKIQFIHPRTQQSMQFSAPWPEDLLAVLSLLKKYS